MKFSSIVLTTVAFLGISSFTLGIDAKASTDLVSEQSAESVTFSAESLQLIRENQLEMGSSEETVDQLIENYLNGGLSDADLLGSEEAISVSTSVEGETTTKTYVYPDGSRAQLIEKAMPIVTTFSGISGGTCQSTSVGTECKNKFVENKLPAYSYSFYVNYYINRYGSDSIQWAGNFNIWMAGGNYANPNCRIVTPVNTSWDSEARLSAQLNVGGEIGSITRSLSFYVGNDKTDWSWNSYY